MKKETYSKGAGEMSNERFKFRVWDNYCKRYGLPPYIRRSREDCYIYDVETPQENPELMQHHFVLEQCTGLKDKNGKLIFEGDVVRVEDECGICDPMMNCDTGIGVITWVCGMWYISRNVNLGLYDAKQVNYIEIIGNIHEMEVGE